MILRLTLLFDLNLYLSSTLWNGSDYPYCLLKYRRCDLKEPCHLKDKQEQLKAYVQKYKRIPLTIILLYEYFILWNVRSVLGFILAFQVRTTVMVVLNQYTSILMLAPMSKVTQQRSRNHNSYRIGITERKKGFMSVEKGLRMVSLRQ